MKKAVMMLIPMMLSMSAMAADRLEPSRVLSPVVECNDVDTSKPIEISSSGTGYKVASTVGGELDFQSFDSYEAARDFARSIKKQNKYCVKKFMRNGAQEGPTEIVILKIK